MRAAKRTVQRVILAAAIACLAMAIGPAGTLTLWVIGLVFVLASIGIASAADNHDIKYGQIHRKSIRRAGVGA